MIGFILNNRKIKFRVWDVKLRDKKMNNPICPHCQSPYYIEMMEWFGWPPEICIEPYFENLCTNCEKRYFTPEQKEFYDRRSSELQQEYLESVNQIELLNKNVYD